MAASAIPVAQGTALRVVTPKALHERDMAEQAAKAVADASGQALDDLANLIRKRFEAAKRQRTSSGVDNELITFMRAYNGEYSPQKIQEITEFGGSTVFARITQSKCRGATSLLRDIYLSAESPWNIEPSPEPRLPGSIERDITSVVGGEAMYMIMNGVPPEKSQLEERKSQLLAAARAAERKKAAAQAEIAERRMNDILVEGRFWEAFSEFLTDLPIYHCAIIKGPTVRNCEQLYWKEDGTPEITSKPKFFWDRVSPFDLWFSPGASRIDRSDTFERQRLSTNDLYELIGLPGYKEDKIREVIEKYESNGLLEWGLMFEQERRNMENQGPLFSNSENLIDCIEFQGWVLGKYLKEFGIEVKDEQKPYFITCWLIDQIVIKAMLNPNIRKRPNYYLTSFDKQPGSLYGAGVAELINDIQDVMNATLRSLVNNMAMASGPQVAFNEELLNPNQSHKLFPWKQWRYSTDPANPQADPVKFFMPNSNAAELMGVYGQFNNIADEVSAIPRYMTGDQKVGGAGRTASGLAMLMTNANKALQNVAENIDDDVFGPLLQALYDLVMLTDETGMLRGDESIKVNGVRNVVKQEQDRVRMIEFLQITANDLDGPLVGPQRASILQQVANRIGIEIDIPEPGEGGPAIGGGAGASRNPTGGPAPDAALSDASQPRLQTQSLNVVSRRGNSQ